MAETERRPDFPARRSRSLRLDTTVGLRWLGVVGQAAALLTVHVGLGYPLPLAACFGLVALSAWINVLLRLRFAASTRLEGPAAVGLLTYDVVQLGGLLYLTGGLENPFTIILLAPVLVSATTLGPRATALLGVVVIATVSVLAFHHLPLPWTGEPRPVFPPLYLVGVWVALVSTLVFTAVYAFRVAEEARVLADALAETELVLAREHHLSALDGLAAAAAHALGTPLGTISLVAKELERELPPGSPLADDIALLRTESERCRDILRRLATLDSEPDGHFDRLPLPQLLEEVIAPLREFGTTITVTNKGGRGAVPVSRRNPAILYGLGNILENAVDFARARVEVVAEWSTTHVAVEIIDDGPGFAPEVIDRIGDPFVTSRGRSRADGVGGGLGLGLFIAKTLLQRTGARLTQYNRPHPETGAIIRIEWPRTLFDAPADERIEAAAA